MSVPFDLRRIFLEAIKRALHKRSVRWSLGGLSLTRTSTHCRASADGAASVDTRPVAASLVTAYPVRGAPWYFPR